MTGFLGSRQSSIFIVFQHEAGHWAIIIKAVCGHLDSKRILTSSHHVDKKGFSFKDLVYCSTITVIEVLVIQPEMRRVGMFGVYKVSFPARV